MVVPVPDGFVIALTYGKKDRWYGKCQAKGGCSLKWKRQDIALTIRNSYQELGL